jgi:chemotaxis response regulator CheB
VVLDTDDNDIFKLALQQESCPEDIILDLWQALDPEVRLLVAKHPNTPMPVLMRMVQNDKDPEVRKHASISYHTRRKDE